MREAVLFLGAVLVGVLLGTQLVSVAVLVGEPAAVAVHARAAEGDALQMPCRGALAASRVAEKYNAKLDMYGGDDGVDTTPLMRYSHYELDQEVWDEMVAAHTDRLELARGATVFEAGAAAGAYLDSMQRRYGVRIAGVDIAERLVDVARRRLNGTFCAGDLRELDFVPTHGADAVVSAGVFMYIEREVDACRALQHFVRIVRPGGRIMITQINDPERRPIANEHMEGSFALRRDLWFRLAQLLGGLEVDIVPAKDIYSRKTLAGLRTYDLHADYRYAVYMRKPADKAAQRLAAAAAVDCNFYDGRTRERRTTDGRKCHLPFLLDGAPVYDCIWTSGRDRREWCSTEPEYRVEALAFCEPSA